MDKQNPVGFEVRTLSNLIKRKIDHLTAEEEDEITSMHGWIISYLYDNQDREVYQRDIEEHFSIRRSSVTNLLQLMEKKELITRATVSDDARLKKIVLTEKSVEIHKRMCSRLERFEAMIVKDIPIEDIKVFYEVVNKMRKNIEG